MNVLRVASILDATAHTANSERRRALVTSGLDVGFIHRCAFLTYELMVGSRCLWSNPNPWGRWAGLSLAISAALLWEVGLVPPVVIFPIAPYDCTGQLRRISLPSRSPLPPRRQFVSLMECQQPQHTVSLLLSHSQGLSKLIIVPLESVPFTSALKSWSCPSAVAICCCIWRTDAIWLSWEFSHPSSQIIQALLLLSFFLSPFNILLFCILLLLSLCCPPLSASTTLSSFRLTACLLPSLICPHESIPYVLLQSNLVSRRDCFFFYVSLAGKHQSVTC